jgi:hypothetical protein
MLQLEYPKSALKGDDSDLKLGKKAQALVKGKRK